jgi:AAA15 family ATPase/GTPase
MTAEGYRKIGVLHRLLCNGSVNPGTTGVLLWDEPEANLNPKLIKELVQVLLALSRNGQQIVLATHDYVLLKWLNLLMDKEGKEDHVRFHVLHRASEDEEVSLHSTDDYDQLINTGISKTFGELYDAEIERSLQGITL